MPAAPADLRAQGQHVADRAAAALAAGLDHEHVAGADGVERALLRVVAAAVRRRTGLRGSAGSAASSRAPISFASGCVERTPSIVTLSRPRLRSCELSVAVETEASSRAQLVGEDEDRLARGLRRPVRLGALVLVDGRLRPEVAERGRALDDAGDEAAGARRARRIRGVDLDLDGVAGNGDGGSRRGAGEDDVAGFERHELREVGDELTEREEEVVGACRPARASPLSQVRTRSAAGSIVRAARTAGPSGVKPSPPLERTLDPLSAARRS